jgi:type VI secretion system secreted protein Hcp
MTKTQNLLAISGAAVLLAFVGTMAEADAAAFMKLGDIKGEATDKDHIGWIELDSFECGIDNTQKHRPGEKGGTEDINIGVGELQECTISKSMDSASAQLAQFAINGNSPGTAEIDFVEVAGSAGEQPVTYLKYKLDRVFIKSWSTSGDADDRPTEEVAFYYNKIAFAYTPEGEPRPQPTNVMSWDNVTNSPWDVFFDTVRELFSPPGKSK